MLKLTEIKNIHFWHIIDYIDSFESKVSGASKHQRAYVSNSKHTGVTSIKSDYSA